MKKGGVGGRGQRPRLPPQTYSIKIKMCAPYLQARAQRAIIRKRALRLCTRAVRGVT